MIHEIKIVCAVKNKTLILPAKHGFIPDQQTVAISNKRAKAKVIDKSYRGRGAMLFKRINGGCWEGSFRTQVRWRNNAIGMVPSEYRFLFSWVAGGQFLVGNTVLVFHDGA